MEIKSENLNIYNRDKVLFFSFPHFEKYPFINHGFTSRLGGVSDGIYESMNLNFASGDNREKIVENYKIICSALDLNFENLVLSSQTHDAEIRCVTEEDMGKGISKDRDYEGIDGLITDTPGIPLVTLYADCVPLFFVDPVKRVVGLAHAGWKGTVKGIGQKMIHKFIDIYGSSKSDILVGIGPSIGQCCLEVEGDVADEFDKIVSNQNSIRNMGKGKYMVDLWDINKEILIRSGIDKRNIVVTDICTKCNKDILFSHRGHNGKRGGMAAIIQINP